METDAPGEIPGVSVLMAEQGKNMPKQIIVVLTPQVPILFFMVM